eukprot:3726223-Rhodomonas_salina.1
MGHHRRGHDDRGLTVAGGSHDDVNIMLDEWCSPSSKMVDSPHRSRNLNRLIFALQPIDGNELIAWHLHTPWLVLGMRTETSHGQPDL